MNAKNEMNYHEQQNIENVKKMRDVLEELPPFCKQFFRGINDTTSARTRLAYAYDVRLFFEFLHENNSVCAKMEIKDYPLSIFHILCYNGSIFPHGFSPRTSTRRYSNAVFQQSAPLRTITHA